MHTVRGDDGRRYLLLKRSADSSLVRDPRTGDTRYVNNDHLEPVEGESSLETVARSVPESARRVCTAVRDERSLGLLVELVDRGPHSVRHLLSTTDYCESDLHGTLAEFRAAGLLDEVETADGRGYGATTMACEGVAIVRGDDA